MKLLLDVGNTRLKWRLLHEQGQSLASGHRDTAHLDEALWHDLPAPQCIHAASVASDAVQQHIARLCQQHWGLTVQWHGVQTSCCGVRNHYRSPGLGVDRWLSVIAAHRELARLQLPAALAVNAGTAVTVDLVSAAGDYLGGTIVPGLNLMRAALAGGTARLPLQTGQFAAVPRTTEDAIHTGVMDAVCGAIERMRARADGRCIVLLSGGDALQLSACLPAPHHTVENLVLDGLQVVSA